MDREISLKQQTKRRTKIYLIVIRKTGWTWFSIICERSSIWLLKTLQSALQKKLVYKWT